MNATEHTSERRLIIGSALLALFLGALDALVMTAAMPTIIAELGGFSLYAWVYSAYFLTRTVSLPVFGKLSDLFSTKILMITAIVTFMGASLAAGLSPSMAFLVGARVFQGIGAGGIFALVYVVLSDVSLPGERGKTLSYASSVWGLSSVVGPTLGGFMVTFFSWPWIFFINVPLGMLSLAGIAFFFKEFREKSGRADLDWAGVTCFSGAMLAVLTLIMTGGREVPWGSVAGMVLIGAALVLGTGFVLAERRARDPFLDIAFFRYPGFALGNAVSLCASFSMFSMFAYAPLFLQGAMSQSPMVVGYAMLFLSLGWSLTGLILGRIVEQVGRKRSSLAGCVFMAVGTGLCLFFDRDTRLTTCFAVFFLIGSGMGCVTLSTLLIVQDSVPPKDLGVATSFQQFCRTLGGTVGVGICGGVVTTYLLGSAEKGGLSQALTGPLSESVTRLFQPEFRNALPPAVVDQLQTAVLDGVWAAFATTAAVSVIGLALGCLLPRDLR